jgi:lysylphosphatidylglycerol synthetase-like protein (DUF2156 family)
LPASLLVFRVVGIIVIAVLAFRPVGGRTERADDDLDRARRIVHTSGWDTLAPFTLRPDKSSFFSSDGRAMLADAYPGRTALGSADPVGPDDAVDLVLDEFLAFTEDRGWDVAFLAVREHDVGRYHARGLHSVYLGDEAIIHCDPFTLDGAPMRAVRQAVSLASRDHRFELLRESDAETALALQAQGAHRLSMNFATWGRLWQDDHELSPGLRVFRWFVKLLNPHFQIKSLYDFNEKFDPEWLPRSIVVTSPASMARVGVLFGGVEGLDLPVVGRYFVPTVVDHTGRAAGGP